MMQKGVCLDKPKQHFKIIETNQSDFFGLLSELPSKRLYIDLWATWCTPCKMEFSGYTEDTYRLLKKYKIDVLFISIDDQNRKQKWNNEINVLGLHGYHLLANEKLMVSIKEIIYDNKQVLIPKYVIVNEKGQILTTDAKHPTDALLEQELDHFFKN